MYKMSEKNFLLQTLLLPLVLLSGHEYGETRQLALTPDAPASRLLGEAIPGNSTDTTWNLIGPPDSRLHLNCTDQTLLKKRIIGGGETEDQAFPFMAAIMLKDRYRRLKMHCGGSIRTVRHIITAAHCLDCNRKDLLVVVGTNNISDLRAAQRRSVSQIIPHEGYRKEGYQHDIAILILSAAIQLGPSVQLVNLPPVRFNFPYNYVGALGWGERGVNGYPVSPALRSVSLDVIGLVECFNRYGPGNVNLDYPTQICVKTQHGDTCPKDSGGPLVIWNQNQNHIVQVGLITEKTRCFFSQVVPRLHTDVFPYVNWIDNKISQIVPPETSAHPGPSHASGFSRGLHKRQKTMRRSGLTAAQGSSRGNS